MSALPSPPANDLCQGAIVVPGSGPFPYLTSIVTNISEATSGGDLDPPASCGVPSGALNSGGIWYAFTPTTSAVYHLSVSDDTETTVRDTVLAVYRSSSGCAGPFTAVDCNDDQGSLTSALAVNLNAGTAYYILVWAAWVPNPTTAQVQLRVSQPTIPANDTCAGAEIISANGPFPYLTQITDTSLATSTGDPPQPSCATNAFDRSVWYRFTPGASRTYVISTCDDTRTSVYDTILAIYTGNCGGSFTQVACSDIFDRRAVITNTFTAGTTYFIVAADASNEGMTPGETLMQLRIFEPRSPAVNTATSLTGTSAVLNSTIPNFNTAKLTAWFEWGLNLGYGNVTPPQSVTTGTNDLRFSAFISSLASGETYHYRVVVSNACFGVMRSGDGLFKWSSARPTLVWSIDAGKLRLQFMGNPGQQYTVLSATAPKGLQPVGLATDLQNGTFEYVDPTLRTTPSRFFLIRSP